MHLKKEQNGVFDITPCKQMRAWRKIGVKQKCQNAKALANTGKIKGE